MLTMEEFAAAVPCSTTTAKLWQPLIVDSMQRWGINTRLRAAGFIAQMSMESRRFSEFTENMNYSPQGLANTWPKHFAVDPKSSVRFPNSLAWKIGRTKDHGCDQQALANLVYGGRFGNRPGTDDGWTYRGRGPKQITFADNYIACGKAIRVDLYKSPDLLLIPRNGAESAAWYWSTHRCNELMDNGDYLGVTRAINGGTNGHEDGNTTGLDDRVELFANARKVLGV